MKEGKNVKNIIENVTVFFLFLLPLFSTVFLYNKISTLIQIIFVFLLLFVTLILYNIICPFTIGAESIFGYVFPASGIQ